MATKRTPTLLICIAGGVATVLALALPGGDDEAPPPNGADGATVPTVEIVDFAFVGPDAAAPGETIEVANADGTPHTLTAADGQFDTGVLAGSATAAIEAPTDPGAYEYFCSIHPSMTGTLTVLE